MATAAAKLYIGPDDQGEPMSLDDFASAEGREGYRYELSRGIITVAEIPNRRHQRLVNAIRKQLVAYEVEHAAEFDTVSGGGESKMHIDAFESERHPDLSVYKTEPPPIENRRLWGSWIPDLVIEVVSPNSVERDYNQKPEEYFLFGVQEYWIIDETKQRMTVHLRVEDE